MVKWKREKVPDHKFDFVDVSEFEKEDSFSKLKYTSVFFIVLKSVLIYIADLYTAGNLLLSEKGGGVNLANLKAKPLIETSITRWVFVGSISISFLLLLIEVRKAKRIVASRDISFAFTSLVAYRYYTLTSYAHWCFFEEIINQQHGLDKVAFFVFFTFKGWKRLLFCDGPRQIINALTIVSVIKARGFSFNFKNYGSILSQASLGVICFTVAVFVISALTVLIAFLAYLPLLCKIRGNLKEYCCHIIDKRIAELLKIQRKRRRDQAERGFKKTVTGLGGSAPTLPRLDADPDSQVQYTNTLPTYSHNDSSQTFYNGMTRDVKSDEAFDTSYPQMGIPRNQPSPHQETYAYPRKGSIGSSEGGDGFKAPIPYNGRRMSDSSRGGAPIYNIQGQPIGIDQYPPRPDSNNSNSAYSDTSTKYSSGQERTAPHQYPPQHKYPYKQMIAGGYNNVDQYGGGGYSGGYPGGHQQYQPPSQQIPYNNPNAPHSNRYFDDYYVDDGAYDYNNYPPSPRSPRTPHSPQYPSVESARQQTTNAIPPPQRTMSPGVRYQQNQPSRPYYNYQ